ncbi:MAG: UDP-N-acetylglucosamine 4,6-dehydratase (inverting) [Patescibacteria group bacterium]
MNLEFLRNKSILITGGTGSFGRGFIKYLIENSQAEKIVIFSRDELKQFKMEEEFKDAKKRLRFFIGDVRDLQRLQRAFRGINIIVHAAALKQVPTLEYNPFEAVKTNIIGSQNVIDAAIDQGVEKVLLISTDKAAQPVNLYGSTKLCAEKLFISGNSYSGGKVKFSSVRYGNVIGSRGSIVETLLDNQGSDRVYITDERMTRFWITIEQAFNLVLFALDKMEGGEIFIPKAPSMKLVDLFDCLAPDAQREVVGIRPGEKLHETLLTKEEAMHSMDLDDYFVLLPEFQEIFSIENNFEKYLKLGKKLSEDIDFTSDVNKKWITKEELKKIIENNLS